MLVGRTGSGKSTMVDSFVNYIIGVDFEHEYRYKIVTLENEEKGKHQNQV